MLLLRNASIAKLSSFSEQSSEPVGRENRNSLSGFSQGSIVSEWDPETSKTYQAITFALTHGIVPNWHGSVFDFFPFICFVIYPLSLWYTSSPNTSLLRCGLTLSS